eukprot:2485343-Pleurochrysis_carterae.AAC.1
MTVSKIVPLSWRARCDEFWVGHLPRRYRSKRSVARMHVTVWPLVVSQAQVLEVLVTQFPLDTDKAEASIDELWP